MKPIGVGSAGQAANVSNTGSQAQGSARLPVTGVTQSAENIQTGGAARRPLAHSPSNASTLSWKSTSSVDSNTSLDSTLGQMPFVRSRLVSWPKILTPATKKSFDLPLPPDGDTTTSMRSFMQERLPLEVREGAMQAFLDQIIPADPSQRQGIDEGFNAILDKHGVTDKKGMMDLFEPLLVKYAKLAITPEPQFEVGRRGSADAATQERFAYLETPLDRATGLDGQKAAIRQEAGANLDLNAAGHLTSSKMAADFSACANALIDRNHSNLPTAELRQFFNSQRRLIAALVHDFAGIVKMGVVQGTDFSNMSGMSVTSVSRATDSNIQMQAEFQALARISQEVARDVKDLLKLTMMTIVDFANTSATEGDGTIFTDATGSRLTSARLTEFTD
ncbi:MAG: hypothetical protein ACRC9T_09385, partial [Vibrionaceae bacterium]